VVFADLDFKVDGGGATSCGMVQHGGTVDVVDRVCSDCLDILRYARKWPVDACRFEIFKVPVWLNGAPLLLLHTLHVRHSIDPE
jgi:hypothetical protein